MSAATVQRLAIVAAALVLGACAHHERPVVQDNTPVYSSSRHDRGQRDRDERPRGDQYAEYGVVRSLQVISGSSHTSGAGAVIGGVTGAVFGREFGGSSYGRSAGAAVGAFVGAILGNEIERQNSGRAPTHTRVLVDLDRGGERRVNITQSGDLRVGDRVRIENNQVFRM